MESLTTASVARYHEKMAGNFVSDWAKKNITMPPKEKALKVLKKYIKDEKDLDAFYKYLPRMVSFLKGKTAMRDPSSDPIFPSGFFKNMIILVAMISIAGQMYPKERMQKELVDQKVIVVDDSGTSNFLATLPLSSSVIKNIDPNKSLEDMNKAIIDSITRADGRDLQKLKKVKYPLELKFTSDTGGNSRIYPSQLKKLKAGDKIYAHREYTPERYEAIEKSLKKIRNENI